MKNTVIEFFQNLPKGKHEQFNEGFKLYRDSPNKNLSIERSLNAGGYSERALENLLYDLQKMHGISDVEKVAVQIDEIILPASDGDGRLLVLAEVAEMELEEIIAWSIERQELFGDVMELFDFAVLVKNEKASDNLIKALDCLNEMEEFNKQSLVTIKEVAAQSEEALFAWGLKRQEEVGDIYKLSSYAASAKDADAVCFLEKIKANLIMPVPPVENGDLLKIENENLKSDNQYLEEENQNLVDKKEELEIENEALKEENQTLKLTPKIDNQSIRVEFPFLNNTDCPDEFKILIADKITAWNRYVELQEQIDDAKSGKTVLSNEELAILGSEAVKCFDENQKIYDELNCYQTTGKVLGVHPIFRKLQLTREVEIMTPKELHNFKNSSAKYFSDNRDRLAKAVKEKNEERIIEINTRVADREMKLALVNKTLGISPK